MLFYINPITLDENNTEFVSELYENNKKVIYDVAYSILKNSHDSEEIVSEVMINVIRNIEKFAALNTNERLAMLITYSKNAAINLYKVKKRRATYEMPFTYINENGESEGIDIKDDTANIDDVISNKENASIIIKCIKQLTIEQQEVIELVYTLGYSNVETAKILGISSNAVGMRLYKAKKKLFTLIKDVLYESIHD